MSFVPRILYSGKLLDISWDLSKEQGIMQPVFDMQMTRQKLGMETD